MPATETGDTSPGKRRYPELPPPTWTDDEIEAWIQSVHDLRAQILARRGRLFTAEEIDEVLHAVREGRD